MSRGDATGLSLGPVCLAIGVAAHAGPVWQEIPDGGGDAGALPVDAQVVGGGGALMRIDGSLDGMSLRGGMGDFQDMYLICVNEPALFKATTVVSGGGSATFDTQLFLFHMSGMGLLANDNEGSATMQSTLLPAATDGSGAVLTTPGLYLLAISGFNSDPLSFGGVSPIFDQVSPTEISGPDGAGGSGMITAWSGPGAIGTYSIFLEGVKRVPGPGAPVAGLFAMALIASRRRR